MVIFSFASPPAPFPQNSRGITFPMTARANADTSPEVDAKSVKASLCFTTLTQELGGSSALLVVLGDERSART